MEVAWYLKLDLNDYIVERHDLSFTTMNKFGGDVFTLQRMISITLVVMVYIAQIQHF